MLLSLSASHEELHARPMPIQNCFMDNKLAGVEYFQYGD